MCNLVLRCLSLSHAVCGAGCGAGCGLNMLSDAKVRKVKPRDKPLAIGGVVGGYLIPATVAGHGKWILRFVSPVTGKRRDMGLGTYPDVGIAEARKSAFAARELIAAGLDPIESRKKSITEKRLKLEIPTFAQAARAAFKEICMGFRNRKHSHQWINTLETYVFPHIGPKAVSELRARDFADALKPIWLSKPETAYRVRQRCDVIMKWCAAREYIVASPLGIIDALLPKQPGKRERVDHHPAVPWRDMPKVYRHLFSALPPTTGRSALEFLILTACRSGEVRGMTWDEINFDEFYWQISAERMKAHKAHTIPLSHRAMGLLEARKPGRQSSSLVFPSNRGTPLSDPVLTKILSDANINSDQPHRHATAHGFRSSFRDWASENGYARDLAERALAHTISSATEAAYHRTDLLDARRPMMNAWAKFVAS
jgi:integrase